MFDILDYGINRYAKQFNLETNVIGRVIKIDGYHCKVFTTEKGIITASINMNKVDLPVVGDFVDLEFVDNNCFISKIYCRLTVINKASNRTKKNFTDTYDEQLLASNIDEIFILIAANQRFTLSKFERYILTFHQEGIIPKVIITKSDYAKEAKEMVESIGEIYPDIHIMTCSIFDPESIDQVKLLIGRNVTVLILGSSGVGKSSLINALTKNEVVKVGQTRNDGKGRHTTSNAYLVPILDKNSYIVDTPGFRGIDSVREVDDSILFNDIKELSQFCKFRDCQHITEKGCAVQEAIRNGELSLEKFNRFIENNKKMLGLKKFEERKNRKKLKAKESYKQSKKDLSVSKNLLLDL